MDIISLVVILSNPLVRLAPVAQQEDVSTRDDRGEGPCLAGQQRRGLEAAFMRDVGSPVTGRSRSLIAVPLLHSCAAPDSGLVSLQLRWAHRDAPHDRCRTSG